MFEKIIEISMLKYQQPSDSELKSQMNSGWSKKQSMTIILETLQTHSTPLLSKALVFFFKIISYKILTINIGQVLASFYCKQL